MFKYSKPNIVCTSMARKCRTHISFTQIFQNCFLTHFPTLWPGNTWDLQLDEVKKICNICQVSDYCHRWPVIPVEGVRNVVNHIWHCGEFSVHSSEKWLRQHAYMCSVLCSISSPLGGVTASTWGFPLPTIQPSTRASSVLTVSGKMMDMSKFIMWLAK